MLWEQELIAIGAGTLYALDSEVGATHSFSQNRENEGMRKAHVTFFSLAFKDFRFRLLRSSPN